MRRISTSQSGRKLAVALGGILAMIAAACSPASTPAAPTLAVVTNTALSAPAATASPAPPTQAEPGVTPADSPAPTEAASVDTSGQLRLVLAAEGNEARYRVQEQLVNVSLPSDAVGVTSAITGMLVVNPDGTLVRDESKFVVDLTTLKSDQSRRDNYIKNNTLETRQYPTAEFAPTEALGLTSPLPTSGSVTFQLIGDLTVHGITRRAAWEVTAQIVDGQALVGSATTTFTFADFGMTAPRVSVVLSVEETIKLELDFRLVLED